MRRMMAQQWHLNRIHPRLHWAVPPPLDLPHIILPLPRPSPFGLPLSTYQTNDTLQQIVMAASLLLLPVTLAHTLPTMAVRHCRFFVLSLRPRCLCDCSSPGRRGHVSALFSTTEPGLDSFDYWILPDWITVVTHMSFNCTPLFLMILIIDQSHQHYIQLGPLSPWPCVL